MMQKPKGTRDLFGEELASIRHVLNVIGDVFKRYGYQEVETPIFENLELFTKKSGATVVKQLYSFKDKSGNELALRPELTAPVVRLYIEKLRSMPKSLKLCYFGNCFRYEEPQAQRWRQFLQAGAEIIGTSRAEADAEVIALADEVMRSLGLHDRKLHVSHVRLLHAVLTYAGVKEDAQDPIMRAIDSREEARLDDEINNANIDEKNQKLLKKLIAIQGNIGVIKQVEKLVSNIPGVRASLENLSQILKYANSLGVQNFTVDLGIARGLEYYTDAVFELYVDGVQVAGGGRYDELIRLLGGEPCPAVGIGFGVDRLANILLKRKVEVPHTRLKCMVLPTNEEMLDECLKLAKDLRAAGLSVDVDLMGRSLTKALAYANMRKAEYAVIVGQKDWVAGEVTVRNMETGRQEKVARANIVQIVQESRKVC